MTTLNDDYATLVATLISAKAEHRAASEMSAAADDVAAAAKQREIRARHDVIDAIQALENRAAREVGANEAVPLPEPAPLVVGSPSYALRHP